MQEYRNGKVDQADKDNQDYRKEGGQVMNVAEIKSKYMGDEFGMEVKVDIEALRSRALDTVREAERMIQNQKDNEKRSDRPNELVRSDKEWQARWKARQQQSVKELRRSVKLASDMLSEVGTILDRAENKLKEVK